jgi:metal-responsive CopG/Arc/MetJ family transcriptional regulator
MSKTTPIPVRLDDELFRDLDQTSRDLKMPRSEIFRASLRIGLPELRRRFGKKQGLVAALTSLKGIEVPPLKFTAKRRP